VGEHRAGAMSQQDIDMRQIPHPWLERVTEALCYAACVDKVELRACLKRLPWVSNFG